jgi:hypothetical protein
MGFQLTMTHTLLQDAVHSAKALANNFSRRRLEGACLSPYRIHMPTRTSRSILLALLIPTAAASLSAALDVSKEQGDRLERKVEEIAKNASAEPVKPKKTPVSERELNSYLNLNLKEKIPRGLTSPETSLLGDGNLRGRVFVDMDEFKRQRGSGGIMDPLSYISGRVPLNASGVLRTRDGKGQFQLTSADIHRIPVPKPLLQELVTFFSRTAENPRGINIDEPFNLPAKIREVLVNQGEAVVIQ